MRSTAASTSLTSPASLSDTVVAGVKASEKAFMFLLASSFPAGLLRYLCPADQKNGHCCLVVGGDSNYKEFVLDDEHPVQGRTEDKGWFVLRSYDELQSHPEEFDGFLWRFSPG